MHLCHVTATASQLPQTSFYVSNMATDSSRDSALALPHLKIPPKDLIPPLQGRNVMIEQSYGGPKITKDGVTVAKVWYAWNAEHIVLMDFKRHGSASWH